MARRRFQARVLGLSPFERLYPTSSCLTRIPLLLPLTASKSSICLKIKGLNHTQPLFSPVFCKKPVCDVGQKLHRGSLRRGGMGCGRERERHHGRVFRRLRLRDVMGDRPGMG
ncbi:hypothetical protein GOX2504 (plasmid) [Gluconobacter oxydans 621H]|uniref:Uncharacterized protein n=1 Tax=Gluconobacter oxydans (strain 621H) TaxID=290633 RepID=Q5HY33_GLUOX|nr:hypothetical protein GOX2504 [Gluconobacter oxydans 621H]